MTRDQVLFDRVMAAVADAAPKAALDATRPAYHFRPPAKPSAALGSFMEAA